VIDVLRRLRGSQSNSDYGYCQQIIEDFIDYAILLPRKTAIALQLPMESVRRTDRIRRNLPEEFLSQRPLEMLRNHCFDISDSAAGEFEYEQLLLREGIIQRMELAQAKIFIKGVRCC